MPCPSCGLVGNDVADLHAGGYDASPACLARYGELTAWTFTLRHPDFPHQYAVDAYAAQHAGSRMKPITIAFALVGLYLHVELAWTGRQVQRAHQLLARQHGGWMRFSPPAARGGLTVGDVLSLPATNRRLAALDRWCRDVWHAWGLDGEDRERVVALSQLAAGAQFSR